MPRSSRTRRLRQLAAVGVTAALAFSLVGIATTPASAEPNRKAAAQKRGPIDVQLLSFNDYHGHLEANTPGTIDVDEVDTPAGGSEYLARHLKKLRWGNKNSFTVAAGDLIGGSTFLSGLFHDEPAVESLNELGMDVSGVGNHEFDEGVRELRRMQRGGCHPVDGCYFEDAPYPGADFPWLAANVKNETTGRTALRPYAVRRAEGKRIAYIGMTLEGTDALVSQSGIEGWSFEDEVRTANRLVPEIRRKGIEAIVVLLHEGGAQSGSYNQCQGISGPVVDIAKRLKPAIDMVITGHTHQAYNCKIKDPAGRWRAVTSAASFGRLVTEIDFKLNRVSGDVRRASVRATNHVVTQNVRPVPAQTAILEKWRAISDVIGNREVGTITEDIPRAYEAGGADDRGAESDASNLIADAQLWATESSEADFAVMAPGGVRGDFVFAESAGEGDGVVSYREAYNIQPFGNLLVTVPMTGQQVITMFEEQCNTGRQFQLGISENVSYTDIRTIDAANARSCLDIEIADFVVDGQPLDLGATYMVTMTNFLAEGNDGFVSLRDIPASTHVGGGEDLAALTGYLGQASPVSPPGTDRVNEQHTTAAAP